jgi:DNA-binding GntR family transcriptional regulator
LNVTGTSTNAAGQPVYIRIADALEREVATWKPGTLLASEHELAATYAVGRLTARAAVEELERRYLVRRSQGRRTYVARRIEYRVGPADAPSWTQSVLAGGGTPRSQTLVLRRRRPPAAARRILGLDATASAIFLARRRFVNDELAAYAETWLAEDLVPDLDVALAGEKSLYAAFQDVYRLKPVRGSTRAEFVVAPAAIARHLGADGRPMTFQLGGFTESLRVKRPIETTSSWLRADIFRVVFALDRA